MRRRLRTTLLFALALAVTASTSATAAPDEALLGKARGYPLGTPATWFFDESVRVGSFSNLDRILPTNRLAKSPDPLPLPVAAQPPRITWRLDERTSTIDDFLARQRVTGLLVIKDGEIQLERYQYDRTPAHRLVSHSMAKSITALAIGFLLAEKKIASLDDPVARYVPELKGNAYGETSIRNILRMGSGVPFKEVYDGKDDLAKFTSLRLREGRIAALRAFNSREVPQGTRFQYASIETQVLGVVIKTLTGGTLADYLTSRLWQPMGAEADANWARPDKDGFESVSGNFNAVLRDYGRLGVLLANDGARDGHQIVPKDYLIEATDWRRQPEAFQPRKATPHYGYGYQFWLQPGDERRFALLGVYGQSIFVDPGRKLVLVITAVAATANAGRESLGREREALWRGLLAFYPRK